MADRGFSRRVARGTVEPVLAALCISSCMVVQTAQAAAPAVLVEMFGDKTKAHWTVGTPIVSWSRGRSDLLVVGQTTSGPELKLLDLSTGKFTVLATPADLTPIGAASPLSIVSTQRAPSTQKVLILANVATDWMQRRLGEAWVYDPTGHKLERLAAFTADEGVQQLSLSPDGRRAAFVYKNDLWTVDIADGRPQRLTSDGSDRIFNGVPDWSTLELSSSYQWRPDGQAIAFLHLDDTQVMQFPMPDELALPTPATRTMPYVLPGASVGRARLGVVNFASAPQVTWLRLAGETDFLSAFAWTADGRSIAAETVERSQKKLSVIVADPNAGTSRILLEEQDAAWVDAVPRLDFTADGKDLVWSSDRDGWKRLYLVREGMPWRAVSPPGQDIVGSTAVGGDRDHLYFLAAPQRATHWSLYSSSIGRTPATRRLTPASEGGVDSYQVSPDGRWAVRAESSYDEPDKFTVVELPSHRIIATLEENRELRRHVATLGLAPTRFFQVPLPSGVELDGLAILPPDFDPRRKYPSLAYVYGGPGRQTVVDRWGGPRALFMKALAKSGYVVLSIDNEGTPAPRGKHWRQASRDRLDAVVLEEQSLAYRRLLRDCGFLDSERTAIWGHSAGGAAVLNQMFRGQGLFKTGIASGASADRRYGSGPFVERYLGPLAGNDDVYRDASAIDFADGLEGNLLILHGAADENVHFQSIDRLADRLIAAGKAFYEVRYPNRSHAIMDEAPLNYYSTLFDFLERNTQAQTSASAGSAEACPIMR